MTDNAISASKLRLETLGGGSLELERNEVGRNSVNLVVRGRPSAVEKKPAVQGGGEILTIEIAVNGYLLGECLKLLGAVDGRWS